MATRMLRNGDASVETTYQLRLIDERGDACEVHDYETAAEAKADIIRLMDGYAACVIERFKSYWPTWEFEEPHQYKTVMTGGSVDALRAGGWIK